MTRHHVLRLALVALSALLVACPPSAVCGNGRVEKPEVCDDGNTAGGDGCEATCTLSPVCGNAEVEGDEACDDGNFVAGDGCEPDCSATPRCGNGVKEGAEACDDGNTTTGDGCENDCTVTVVASCTNGVREGNEECDDGNTTPGDGCEASCTFSAGAVTGCPGMNVAPPASGTCTTGAGDGSTLITGVILGDGVTYVGGQVLVATDGTIACAACDCSAAAGAATATRLTCPRGVVSPGLINAHDHISFQANPWVGTSERYEHRHDWRRGNDGHTAINNGGNATNAQIRWAELRQVMSGTTSIVGATFSVAGNQGLLRNLDTGAAGQLGLNAGTVNSDTFPLADTSGLELTAGCGYPALPTGSSIPAGSAWLPHISEGIEQSAWNEFRCIAQQAGVLGARTGVVHGIGLKAADVQQLAQAGGSLVWSPRSNVSLYGDTAAVPLFRRLGVNLALGTDWTISGSMNMLRELKCADFLNRTRFDAALSDEALWRAATAGGADATATANKLGRLAAGKLADLAVYRRRGTALHRSVIDAEPADVVLTMRGGKALYGDQAVVAAFDAAAQCEALEVCGTSKAVCVRSELTTALTGAEPGTSLASLQRANASTYPLFACAAPANEPSCVPERAARNVKNGSTEYPATPAPGDRDGDGVADGADNCPGVFNPVRPMDNGQQANADGDPLGDVCDPCPRDANSTTCTTFNPNDLDGDGRLNAADNCPADPNPNQEDGDGDLKGDACDPCPAYSNPGAAACLATIYQLKTPGSALVGQRIQLEESVVTAVGASGFFLQVLPSDGGSSPPEWSGIFAYRPASGLDAGDRVVIPEATAADYFGQLQLSIPSVTDGGTGIQVVSSGNPLPAPVLVVPADVAFRGDAGRAEQLEAVLVRVENVGVVDVNPDAGAGDRPPYNEFVVTGGLRVNDYLYLLTPFPSLGQQFTALTGVLEYRSNNFKLEPRGPQDVATGPALVASVDPATAFIREDAGATIPQPLVVRLSNTEASDVEVTVTASGPEVAVGDGGLVVVPANQLTAPIPLFGVTSTDGGAVAVTATRGTSSKQAAVRVLGALEPSRLVALSPATAAGVPGGTVRFTVALDVPAAAQVDVTLALAADAGFGTLPSTATVAVDQVQAGFDLALDAQASGAATVTASYGSDAFSAQVTAQLIGTDHVVISELAGKGPANTDDEFVELYNPTAQAVDVSGWRLEYRSATGASWSLKATIPANTSIPPRRYFLVASPAYAGANAPDLRTATNMQLSGNSGHVRLVDDALVEVDKLGYGAAGQATPNSPEGTAMVAAAALSVDQSYERKALPSSTAASMTGGGADAARGNGEDTDDNAGDFVVRALRDPQNLSSPAEP